MTDEGARIAQLHAEGFYCSQILVILGLERQGKSSPELVRAMAGLANGLGDCGKICGVLTGAACLLGLYAGRGERQEEENRLLNVMIQELVAWFEERFAKDYGGVDCRSILGEDAWNRLLRCPGLVSETYFKTMAILEENGLTAAVESEDG